MLASIGVQSEHLLPHPVHAGPQAKIGGSPGPRPPRRTQRSIPCTSSRSQAAWDRLRLSPFASAKAFTSANSARRLFWRAIVAGAAPEQDKCSLAHAATRHGKRLFVGDVPVPVGVFDRVADGGVIRWRANCWQLSSKIHGACFLGSTGSVDRRRRPSGPPYIVRVCSGGLLVRKACNISGTF